MNTKLQNILAVLLLIWLPAPSTAQTDTTEPRLVKVEYRKEPYVRWFTPTPELEDMATVFVIYRDRTYDNGETFTDQFTCGMVGPYIYVGHEPFVNEVTGEGEVALQNGEIMKLYPWHGLEERDYEYSYGYSTRSIAMPDISVIKEINYWDSNEPADAVEIGPRYIFGNSINVNPDGVEFIGANGTSSLATGWYFNGGHNERTWSIYYEKRIEEPGYSSTPYWGWLRSSLNATLPNACLVVDGNIITFDDMRTPLSYTQNERDVYLPGNVPAKIFTQEVRTNFLGMDIYGYAIDTVFQYTGTPPANPPSHRAPQHTPKQQSGAGVTPVHPSAPAGRPASALRRDTPMVTIDDEQPTYIYGGKPKGRKGMF